MSWYIPVGTELSPEQISGYGLAQFQNRDIFDPAYTGFEENFDWRLYIRVEHTDPILQAQFEQTMEQFSRTPDGQHLMRQAHAMQTYRNSLDPSTADNDPRISIQQDELVFNATNGYIGMDRGIIERTEYLGTDGQFHDLAVQSAVLHELLHAADPLQTTNNQRSITSALGNYQAFEGTYLPIDEYAVFRHTNVFMARYYDEPERFIPLVTGELSDFVRLVTDISVEDVRPSLGLDHFYDDIRAPELPRLPSVQVRE
jgi:hypothetical protein